MLVESHIDRQPVIQDARQRAFARYPGIYWLMLVDVGLVLTKMHKGD